MLSCVAPGLLARTPAQLDTGYQGRRLYIADPLEESKLAKVEALHSGRRAKLLGIFERSVRSFGHADEVTEGKREQVKIRQIIRASKSKGVNQFVVSVTGRTGHVFLLSRSESHTPFIITKLIMLYN